MGPLNAFLLLNAFLRFFTIMEDKTPKTHPSWRQGAKNTFSSTFSNIYFAP